MQELRPEERREFQRIHVGTPIPATLSGVDVLIIEIGVLGARVQQPIVIEGKQAELKFDYKGGEIDIKCDFIRTSASLQSGLRFIAAVGESGDRLREMLGELVTEEINARRNHTGARFEPAVDGDRTVRERDAGFYCFRFENGKWSKRSVFLPEQPASGFTVSRASDADELQRLCQVYEASDDEGRRLIRVFAELSVSDALQIPPPV